MKYKKIKRVAIVRGSGTIVNLNSYNSQSLGLAKALVKKFGVDVDIYFCGVKNEIVEHKINNNIIRVLFLKFIKLPMQQAIMLRLKEHLISGHYDIIQVQEYNMIASYQVAKYFKDRRPSVILIQGPNQDSSNKIKFYIQKIYDTIIWPLYKDFFDGYGAKTQMAKSYLIAKGIESEQIAITPIGLDTEKFKNFKSIDWRKDLGISKESKVILNIGNVTANKNTLFLIKVFSEFLKTDPNSYFVWIGKTPDKEYFNKCNDLIKKLKIEKNIMFPGSFPQEALPSAYKMSDLLIYYTYTGIFGMVFLESMYFNLPVITNYSGGSIEIIEDNNNGIIMNDSSPTNWAFKMHTLLNDVEKYNYFKKSSGDRINQTFLWEKTVLSYMNLYIKSLK